MLYNNDAANIGKYVQPQTADVIIFDPPYGIGTTHLDLKKKKWKKTTEEWDQFASPDEQYSAYEKWLHLFIPLLKPTGSIFIFGSMHNIFMIGDLLQRKLQCKIINTIVWNKVNAMFNITRTSIIEGTEYIIWAKPVNSKHFFNYEKSVEIGDGKQLRNVWAGTTQEIEVRRTGHPHQKPCWLVQRLLAISCPPGGLVVDPMAGSGTTAVVCHYLNLKWICIEKDTNFYEMAQRRITDEQRLSYVE